MRTIFGVLSLLVALAVAGVLLRQQLKATHSSVPVLQLPVTPSDSVQGGTETVTLPASSAPAQQNQDVQEQFKQALDHAIQARPLPDDPP